MTRVSKEPEVRRQEILEAAMAVFSEKGYDKTKMSDIADRVGIAQGLCYRYFPSKELLFDGAIEAYAKLQADQMKAVLADSSLSLREKLEKAPSFIETEKKAPAFYQAFHNDSSRKIHEQLALKVCELMVPSVAEAIKMANENGEVNIPDYQTAASFGVYGQLGILLDKEIAARDKVERLRSFLIALFVS